MESSKGLFIISLDFELYWGMHATKKVEEYRNNLLGERRVIPILLDIFKKYNIAATWAIVGLLFFENRQELLNNIPTKKPKYHNPMLSSYHQLDKIGENEFDAPFYYAPSLVKLIASYPNQEIASHTFSHYFCTETGADKESFQADLEAAMKAGKKYNKKIESLVFPRNQFNNEFKQTCREAGIKSYRGNESPWVYREGNKQYDPILKRVVRLCDHYLNLFGHNCYRTDLIVRDLPYNIRSSRFLRPYISNLRIFEPLRLRRILSDLTYAAKNKMIYHLWWHPHNFGTFTNENLSVLRQLLDHYIFLNKKFGFQSMNMNQVAELLSNQTF